MTSPHILSFTLLLTLCACGTASPSRQPNTAPLRTGQQTALSVGEKTREVQTRNKDLVLYATSIDEEATPAPEDEDLSTEEQDAVTPAPTPVPSSSQPASPSHPLTSEPPSSPPDPTPEPETP